jgi:hypothetical protein
MASDKTPADVSAPPASPTKSQGPKAPSSDTSSSSNDSPPTLSELEQHLVKVLSEVTLTDDLIEDIWDAIEKIRAKDEKLGKQVAKLCAKMDDQLALTEEKADELLKETLAHSTKGTTPDKAFWERAMDILHAALEQGVALDLVRYQCRDRRATAPTMLPALLKRFPDGPCL